MRLTLGELRSMLVTEAGFRASLEPKKNHACISYDSYGQESIYVFANRDDAEEFMAGMGDDEKAVVTLDVNQGDDEGDSDEATARKFEDMAEFLERNDVGTVWDSESEEGGPIPAEAYVADLKEQAHKLYGSASVDAPTHDEDFE